MQEDFNKQLPITSKDKFTDNLKELPVNIIKDENTDKFEGMF